MKACFLLAVLLAAPVLADEPDLAEMQARLDALTARIDRAGGQDFAASRRIHIDVNRSVFATWLAAVAPNGLTATATGTRFEGRLVDALVPVIGPVTARLDPASATRLDLTLRNPQISAAAGQLIISGDLSATARAQVRFTVNGRRPRVNCQTPAEVRERGRATLILGTPTGATYPFTANLDTPADFRVGLDCNIDELRQIEKALPVNGLAGQLARGTIDIGLSKTLQLPSRSGGAPLTVTIAPLRPLLQVTEPGISYSAD